MRLLCPHVFRFVLLLMFQHIFPQTVCGRGYFTSGARSAGLANASVALAGTESLWGNPAGLAATNHFSLLLAHESRFLLKEFSAISAGFLFPLLSGVSGVSFSQFGNQDYREQLVSLSVARKFGESFFASVRLKRGSVHFPAGYDPHNAYSMESGIQIRIFDSLVLGFQVADPFPPRSGGNAHLPLFHRMWRLGVVWHLSGDLLWSTELEKSSHYPWILKSGIEYQPAIPVRFRAGISGHPLKPAGGIGFVHGRKAFDLGFAYHSPLGFTPVSTITFGL